MSGSTPAAVRVLRLGPADAERYVRLRRRMLEQHPWAYSSDLDDDFVSDPSRVAAKLAAAEDAVFAVESDDGDGALVAATGVMRAKKSKYAHRATIWGVFVEPAYRRRGIGRALLAAALDLARTWPGVSYVDLAVSENSAEARELYHAFGFQTWGREPETTAYGDRRFDEIYMTLRL